MSESEQLAQIDAIRRYLRLAESELYAAEREVQRNGKLSEGRYDFIQYYINQADDELNPLYPVAYPEELTPSAAADESE